MVLTWRNDVSNNIGKWQIQSTSCGTSPESIVAGLASLSDSASPHGRLSVTLGRPVAHTRTLPFPAMARTAFERVVARDWTRHIIGIRATPHTVAGEPVGRGRWRAAFAPTDVLDAVSQAAAEQGWAGVDIRTADDAIAGAVRTLAAAESREADLVAVVCDGTGPTDILHLRNGSPWLGRSLLVGAGDNDVAAFVKAHAHRAPVVMFGGGPRGAALARSLGDKGHRTHVVDTGLPADASAASTLAVLGTLSSSRLSLRAPAVAKARERQMRGVTRWLVAATGVALLAALGLEHWRIASAVSDVRFRRADISAQVSNAIVLRSAIEADVDVASALATREAQSSHASAVLAAVTLAMPTGTALTALSVAGDSISVEGESRRSAAVYESLRVLPMLTGVKLASPLRQARQAGDVAVEHFAFSARVRDDERRTPSPKVTR
ncbi:hypothetical protein BH11GEM1_BH11GEM1_26190 [soil metagenome]